LLSNVLGIDGIEGFFYMRMLVSALAVIWFGVGLMGCGDSGKVSASKTSTSVAVRQTGQATIAFGIAHSIQGLKGDEDDDEPESTSTGSEPNGDNDGDNDNDVADNAKQRYYDGDDSAISAFGRPASSGEERALTSVVKRYYDAAVKDDGTKACSLILPSFARAIPEDFGRVPGPLYLRGAKTCPAVMSRVFRHERARLTAVLVVTGARVKAGEAYVLLGSKRDPASYVFLRRYGRTWRIVGLLSSPLP
jgi:hypothetical protein